MGISTQRSDSELLADLFWGFEAGLRGCSGCIGEVLAWARSEVPVVALGNHVGHTWDCVRNTTVLESDDILKVFDSGGAFVEEQLECGRCEETRAINV